MSEQEQRNPMTTTPEQVAETPGQIANYLTADLRVFMRGSMVGQSIADSLCDNIAAALRAARFTARRECENELEALGLKVAFQDDGRAETTRMRILRLCNAEYWRTNGITQEEICELVMIGTSTCNPRVNELTHKLGYLRIIGVRKISTGRNAQVYQITTAGRERLGDNR